MNGFDANLTTAAAGRPLVEILHASPEWILGVSSAAALELKKIGIETVFDLASSRIFASARLLDEAGSDPQSVVYRFGMVPADVVNALPAGVTLGDLRYQTLEILEGITSAAAVTLADALNVANVRELALWPPYAVARQLVQAAFLPETLPSADPEAPADLLPKSGIYPVERVFYSTLVFDGAEKQDLPELETATPLDLAPVLSGESMFKTPGEGALLTFSQSWYAQGVALGQLLHSVALAPGESTRIAMIDWSRRTAGRQDESAAETESLANIADHTRSLAEVTNAVAAEAQGGFSQTNMTSSSESGGSAFGFSMGPVSFGDSGGSAATRSSAMSFSSSAGRRELFGEMTQNVVDRTYQQAHAARNRRASVVREVSQEEHETVSTRTVTNYNHMHALSVQYYETVQIYRVSVELAKIEKCLFVPLGLLDFTDDDIVRRFHPCLLAAAIDEEARRLISTNYRMVEFKTLGTGPLSIRNAGMLPYRLKEDSKVIELPPEARLHNFYLMPAGDPAISIAVKLRDGTIAEAKSSGQNIDLPDRPALREIASITGTNPTPNPFSSYVALSFTFGGWPFGVDVQMDIPKQTTDLPLLVSLGGGIRAELVEHLMANRLHYSQAAFLALDQAEVVLLLSGYNFGGKPVSSIIDPKPLTVAGNYVVFRMRMTPDAGSEDPREKAWAEWLVNHGLDKMRPSEDLVPLPSGGVFAEAVLGRYNSAEKLDLTRFWNWQDSPIPIVAPEIAALQAGSRAAPEPDLKAGQFSQPLVSIVNPTSLPEPTGLAAALNTIGNGNMFRDMSGLAATIGLAQSGASGVIEAATAGQMQAGANLATAAKKEVEMFKAALAFVATMYGRGSADTSPSTISNEGAKINHGRDMDRRGGSTAPTTGKASTSVTAPGGGSGGAQRTAADALSAGDARSNENAAFQRALWGSDGQSRAELTNGVPALTGALMNVGATDADLVVGPAAASALSSLSKNEYQRRLGTSQATIASFSPSSEASIIMWAKEFDAPPGLTVRNWSHAGVSHYTKDSSSRDLSPVRRPDNIWQIVLHETAGWSIGAAAPWTVHFTVGPDAIVYQHCDIALFAEHANQMNPFSVGIEFTNPSVFGPTQPGAPPLTATQKTWQLLDLQGGSVGGTVTDDRERIPIKWLSGVVGTATAGEYYVLPPQNQLVALARLVHWLTAGPLDGAAIDAPPTWRQLTKDPTDPAKTLFIMTFHPAFETAVGSGGIFPHILYQRKHFDGSAPGLFTWLVLDRKLDETSAYLKFRDLISDPKYYRAFDITDGAAARKVHCLDVSELADTSL